MSFQPLVSSSFKPLEECLSPTQLMRQRPDLVSTSVLVCSGLVDIPEADISHEVFYRFCELYKTIPQSVSVNEQKRYNLGMTDCGDTSEQYLSLMKFEKSGESYTSPFHTISLPEEESIVHFYFDCIKNPQYYEHQFVIHVHPEHGVRYIQSNAAQYTLWDFCFAREETTTWDHHRLKLGLPYDTTRTWSEPSTWEYFKQNVNGCVYRIKGKLTNKTPTVVTLYKKTT